MKRFFAAVGNVPYQQEQSGTSARPIYPIFLDDAFAMAHNAALIVPARFLFDAGKTPKSWNQRMLQDRHLRILDYEPDSRAIFPNADIKGGLAVVLRNDEVDGEPIGLFVPYPQMRSILQKVDAAKDRSLSEILYSPESYHFTDLMHGEHPEARTLLSKSHEHDLTTNIFTKLPHLFTTDRPRDAHAYVRIYGMENTNRCYKWVRRDYIAPHPNLYAFKVLLPKSNGAGVFGETLSASVIGERGVGHTQSFLSMGAFETIFEAEALQRYLATKFARAMLGVRKVTQDNRRKVWTHVPLLDFTPSSGFARCQTTAEANRWLYATYHLTDEEIAFIESHVREMPGKAGDMT